MKPRRMLTPGMTVLVWFVLWALSFGSLTAKVAKAAPTVRAEQASTEQTSAEQIRSCVNAVVLRLNGVPRSEIAAMVGSVQPDGVRRVNWEAGDGRFGFCRLGAEAQVADLVVENNVITHPLNFEPEVVVSAGAVVITTTNGGSLNLRSSPGGEIIGRIPAGSALVLTGQTQGEWVEIEIGGWISRYLIAQGDPSLFPISAADLAPVESSFEEEEGDLEALEAEAGTEDTEVEDTIAVEVGASGREMVVTGSGSGINIRRAPNGEVFASVPDGATLILTGARNGSWVEIQGGGWVSEAYLQPK